MVMTTYKMLTCRYVRQLSFKEPIRFGQHTPEFGRVLPESLTRRITSLIPYFLFPKNSLRW